MSDIPLNQLTKEQTQAQLAADVFTGFGGFAPGGSVDNPLGYHRYNDGPFYSRLSYPLIRLMRRHATLHHVRVERNAAILASYLTPKVKKNRNVSKELVDAVDETFNSLWERRAEDMMFAEDYGWKSGELLWSAGANETRLDDWKPLTNDYTGLLNNRAGRVAGVVNGTSDLKVNIGTVEQPNLVPGLPAPFKVLVFTHGREDDNYYGESWYASELEPWKQFLTLTQELFRLIAKTSGIQVVVTSPPEMKDTVNSFLKRLGAGNNGIRIDSLASLYTGGFESMSEDNLRAFTALIGASVIKLDTIDTGNNGPAIQAIQALLVDNRSVMFEAGGRSPRTGLESEHGSRADASEHKSSAMLSDEARFDAKARQLQPAVDCYCQLNDPSYQPGDIYLETPDLQDVKAILALKRVGLMTSGTSPVSQGAAEIIDFAEDLRQAGFTVKEGAVFKLPEPAGTAPFAGGKAIGDDTSNIDPKVASAVSNRMLRSNRRQRQTVR